MLVTKAPADTVRAAVERVWELLMQPAGYGRFRNVTVERVEPDGPAAVGQKFVGWTRALCRRWRIDSEIQEVDAQRHYIGKRKGFSSDPSRTSRRRHHCAYPAIIPPFSPALRFPLNKQA